MTSSGAPAASGGGCGARAPRLGLSRRPRHRPARGRGGRFPREQHRRRSGVPEADDRQGRAVRRHRDEPAVPGGDGDRAQRRRPARRGCRRPHPARARDPPTRRAADVAATRPDRVRHRRRFRHRLGTVGPRSGTELHPRHAVAGGSDRDHPAAVAEDHRTRRLPVAAQRQWHPRVRRPRPPRRRALPRAGARATAGRSARAARRAPPCSRPPTPRSRRRCCGLSQTNRASLPVTPERSTSRFGSSTTTSRPRSPEAAASTASSRRWKSSSARPPTRTDGSHRRCASRSTPTCS